MCTVLFAWQQFEETPLAVAANRDESPGRPTSPPGRVPGDLTVLMPRDERDGGTWMGVNEHRLFAIVANRWTDAERDGGRSRGLLVRDVLSAESVDGAASILRDELATTEYEGFTLLVGTSDTATVFMWDGALTVKRVDPGVHVIVNVGVDGAYRVPEARSAVGEEQAKRADRIRETLQVRSDETAQEWVERARRILSDHDIGTCVHRDRYETVSSSLVALGADGEIDWRYADGPPCRTEFRAVDDQI
ncbi:NRDE family protein [Halanaeroarchaeum sulfurireducens]|uniref:NRDE family protein n=1 Tax=Halanaeroarchaeum sulfurireducens TaxID=1604004 RepID=A0A0N9N529_9EURY|nr:NRDE family protein [Halanaeroarchaeum sulfurireducens]ALG82193.1 hypothetical protein HLASA_1300 [Halanaeroarchaeum sulfurireducens]